jgi:multiple sugar transport system substrate-binding protein
MKFRTRTRALGALGLTVGLMLAGCATASSSNSSSDGKGTVSIWYLADQESFINAIKPAFEAANPGITLDATQVPEDNYVTKIDTAILAHQPPDIVFEYDAKWIKAGDLLPIDSLMKSAGVNLSSFSPVPMADCRMNGKTYCVGSLGGAHLLIYNKAMFDAAGLAYPSATQPMTIDQFAALAAKLTKPNADANKRVYGALTGTPVDGNVTPLSFFSKDGKKIQGYVDDKATIHLFSVMAQMVKDGDSVPPSVSALKADADVLTSGEAAMAITDMEYTAKALDAAHIRWGAAPSPVEKAGDPPYVFGGTDKYGIVKGGSNTAGAKKFLVFLAKHGSQIRLDKTDTPPLDTSLMSKWAGTNPGRLDVEKVVALSKSPDQFVPDYWDQVGPLSDLYTQMANGVVQAGPALKKAAPGLQTSLNTAWQTWKAIK